MSERHGPFYDVPTVPVPEISPPVREPSLEAIRELVRVEVRKALNEIITEIRMQQHEGLTILR